jgi:hypothetical protein
MGKSKSVVEELLGLHKLIKDLMLSDKRYRDNDALLVNRIQKDELEQQNIDLRFISAYDYFKIRLNKTVSSESTILRARRKVNEHFPETRGLSYKSRQAKQVDVIDTVREIGKEMKSKPKADCFMCQGTGKYENYPCNVCCESN